MHVSVQKYGGTSLRDASCLKTIADRVVDTQRAGYQTVVVVSAMGNTTNELIDLAGQFGPEAHGRELDALLSTGECTSAALLAMAIQQRGVPACSMTGAQAGILTDRAFGRAHIVDVHPARVSRELTLGQIVVVAGFQGKAQDTGCITTLGRGGSDATATALAAALRADVCEIGTDVDGVYTADPRHVPDARKLDSVGYDQMLELARGGAKVLMPRCVEYARTHGVRLHVRAANGRSDGTWVEGSPPESTVERLSERPAVLGLAHLAGQVRYTVNGVLDQPESLLAVFSALTDSAVDPDQTTWTQSATRNGALDVSFVAPGSSGERIDAVLDATRTASGGDPIQHSEPLGKLSVVGSRLRSHPSALPNLLHALSAAGVGVKNAEVCDSRITVGCEDSDLIPAVVAAHDAFGLAEEGGGQPRYAERITVPKRVPAGRT
ncbi:MAG: aspartate kinase [Pseudonocardiaceae bacterium]|nr:aspartate kinase [Pseudonocardiaceae bacterium]